MRSKSEWRSSSDIKWAFRGFLRSEVAEAILDPVGQCLDMASGLLSEVGEGIFDMGRHDGIAFAHQQAVPLQLLEGLRQPPFAHPVPLASQFPELPTCGGQPAPG